MNFELLIVYLAIVLTTSEAAIHLQINHRKDIFEKAFKGEITPDVPASYLQEHSDCTVMYCD